MMKTYIKKDYNGYYVEMSDGFSGEVGTTFQDFLEGKYVPLSDEQVTFRNEHPTASLKEVFDMEIIHTSTMPYEELRTMKIQEKLWQIEQYDSSERVNSFNVVKGGKTVSAWLTPAERANYRSSIDAAELVGVENLSLYIGEMPITLPTQTAKLMLAQIQLYADQCFIVTKQHKANVEALDTIEEIDAYQYQSGYPEKLTFEIPD